VSFSRTNVTNVLEDFFHYKRFSINGWSFGGFWEVFEGFSFCSFLVFAFFVLLAWKESEGGWLNKLETRFKKRMKRKCKFCGNVRGLIRKYELYVCRKCFREIALSLGFKKYS